MVLGDCHGNVPLFRILLSVRRILKTLRGHIKSLSDSVTQGRADVRAEEAKVVRNEIKTILR